MKYFAFGKSARLMAAIAVLFLTVIVTSVRAQAADRITAWSKRPDGVVLRTQSGGTLRLQVWNPDVIRVTYVPLATLPSLHSLAVIGAPNAKWSMRVDAKAVIVRTTRIQARVDRSTGAVRFLDASGATVLGEQPGTRIASPVSVAGSPVPLYQIVQKFSLTHGEGIYGLGQHQNGMMDYRGAVIKLLQQNRDVGIPFLVSSKGYGVLWDTPSVTTISVGVSPPTTIPSTRLFTEDGKPGGLTARYYNGRNFDQLVDTRIDPSVDFDWSQTPPRGLTHDDYSVRWTGYVQANKAGDYRITTSSDDGVRVWIDDTPVIDDWSVHAATEDSATVSFKAAGRHKLRIDYFQGGGGAVARLSWSVPSKSPSVAWSSETADALDYYFVYGPSIDRVIADYRTLTGQAPMPPRWALGFWQSKEHYAGQQELLDVVGKYRADHIPIDTIVQDWQYWTPHPWGSHEFDAARYPDPAAMVRELHDEHAHMMISVWAKFDSGCENLNELEAVHGVFPQTIKYVYPPGEGKWYDPFNPTARKVYWSQIWKHLGSIGIDGWWLDASEPELSGNWGEFRNYTTAAGPGTRVFNAYPLEHTRAVYEGQRRQTDRKRVVILTRSAYTGQQRNAAITWSGDITGNWDTFARQIPAGLNFSLSGIPYWNTDIGGFFVPYKGGSSNPEYRELFTRWFEFGAFCPIFRVHGTDTPKELWRFGPETEKTLIRYDDLRYRLMPYLYSQAWQVTHSGRTFMRPLVMDFPNDGTARDCVDEYLFGPSILVCPVTKQGATTRAVYLPGGPSWIDFWTGKSCAGGRSITADAPLDRIPLFIRAGSIVPMGPVIPYADAQPDAPIELRVYPGANGAFTLYDDAGDSYDYEKGAYATVPFEWNDAKRVLTIGARSGHYPGMPARRKIRIVLVKDNVGAGIAPSTAVARTIDYSGAQVIVHLASNEKP